MWLWWTTNLLTGLVAVATIVFYVFVYTLLIKRRTSNNVVWGGAANGMPVLIGWSAVTGTIGWQALVMFAIVFFWTPPHSWALAMRHREDYRAAGVPMLPAVATEQHVAKQILVYTWLTAFATLLLALATGWLYERSRCSPRPGSSCGSPTIRSGASWPPGRTTPTVQAVQHLPGLRVLRGGDRFGAGAAESTGALNAWNPTTESSPAKTSC